MNIYAYIYMCRACLKDSELQRHMRTYADVCGHTLTYADVCAGHVHKDSEFPPLSPCRMPSAFCRMSYAFYICRACS